MISVTACDVHRPDQRKAEAGGRGKQLADQRAQQRQGDADADAGENLGQRRRRHDRRRRRHRRQSHDARGAVIDRRDVAHRIHREDRDREDAVDHAECDLGRNAEAEDQKNQRIERDLGDRIERAEDRIGHVAGKSAQAEPQAEHDAAAMAMTLASANAETVLCACTQKPLGLQQLDGARDGRGRRRNDIGPDRPVHKLPEQQQSAREERHSRTSRLHRWPKRRCSRFSQAESAPLTTMTPTNSSSSMPYMVLLSKLS